MIQLQPFARTFTNHGEGPPDAPDACAVQGGPGCAAWGSGGVWGDGTVWCSNVGVPYEFVAEQEVRGHRIAAKIKFTYCYTPGLPEAFRIFQLRARWAPQRQAEYPYHAFLDATTPSERLSAKIKYTAVPGIADQSGNDRHGSIVGTPGFRETSAVQSGYAMHFGPTYSDAHCSVPYNAIYSATPMSVEFWAKLDDTSSNEWNTPVVQSTSNQWNDGWGFYDRHSTGQVTFWVNAYDGHAGPVPNRLYVQVARPTRAEYHHYVGTYDGTELKLYIDGVLAGSTSGVVSPVVSTAPVFIGYGGFAQSGWEGTVDEVAVYDSALTDYQVIRHYETERNEYRAVVLQDFPVGYWTLDEEGPYGNEFKVYQLRLIAQRKKHQPKG